MIAVVYTDIEAVSRNAGECIIRRYKNGSSDWNGNMRVGNVVVLKSEVPLLRAEYIDGLGFESVLFVSRHRSEKGVVSFTVHPLGNWTGSAELGGKPNKLSVSEPIGMLYSLREMTKFVIDGVNIVYEATHHGPLLNTPSCFVEFGGPQDAWNSIEHAELLGTIVMNAAMKLADNESEFAKVVIGVGGTHYPEKFTKLALEKGYAFSHMMPKHAIINNVDSNNLDMLERAVESSRIRPESAVIDWKSLNSETRSAVIKKLNSEGLDYEKV